MGRSALWRSGRAAQQHSGGRPGPAARARAAAAPKVKGADATTFERPGWAVASPPPRRPLAALAALSALTEDYPDTGYVVNLPV